MPEKTGTDMYVLMDPNRIQNGSIMEPQGSIGKESKEKVNIDQDSIEKESPGDLSFGPLSAAFDYEIDYDIDYEKFLDLYQRICQKLGSCQGLPPPTF